MNNLEVSIVETIKNSDLSSLSQDYAEVLLDSVLKDGFLKDIPIVNTVVSLTKVGIEIKNMLFTKKLIKFLFSFKDISLQNRKQMIYHLENDNSFKAKVGEYIILLLDKCDDMVKPTLIGNAFKAYILKRISASELRKINFGIDTLFIPNIEYLKDFYSGKIDQLPEDTHQNLSLCGFAHIASADGSLVACKSKLGELFVNEVIIDAF